MKPGLTQNRKASPKEGEAAGFVPFDGEAIILLSQFKRAYSGPKDRGIIGIKINSPVEGFPVEPPPTRRII